MKQPRTIVRDFGLKVRAYRKHHGLTLSDVENRSGISRGLLSKIENGAGNPSLVTIHKLARAVRVSVAELTS